jgi:Na+-transporting methylmalonyl-CoA/oxaloacetate decarboxylase gamma subunit
MGENLSNALLITAIGMGLVFLALILLWGLMALMVRLFADRGEPAVEVDLAAATPVTEPTPLAGSEHKRRAAAAAVAAALAMHGARRVTAGAGLFAPQNHNTLSAWQTALRANQLKSKQQRGPAR